MKTILENNTDFNVKLEPSDWRFSAAIVGLLEYFEYIDTLETSYKVEDEYILYNSELITKENYLKFVEKKYGENLHHKYVELNLEHYNQDNNENDNNSSSTVTRIKRKASTMNYQQRQLQERISDIQTQEAKIYEMEKVLESLKYSYGEKLKRNLKCKGKNKPIS